jgi:polar amino acid transport system permease protein
MHWSIIWEYRDALYQGLVDTLLIASVAIPGSLLLGLTLGCVASLPGWLPRELVTLYVAPMRNLPIVVKLFFFYFVLGLDAWTAGILTLILHYSASIADITRAGARSVPREQLEAARACGHSYAHAFRYVLLPQILRVINPPLTSQFIDIVKNSSVCMLIGVQELTFQTQEINQATFRGFEAATAVSVLYLLVALAIAGAMAAIRQFAFVQASK